MGCSACEEARRRAIESAKAGNVSGTARAIADGAKILTNKVLGRVVTTRRGFDVYRDSDNNEKRVPLLFIQEGFGAGKFYTETRDPYEPVGTVEFVTETQETS